MKKFKNYEELAHYWANNDCQNDNDYTGRTYCGRMSYYRDKIYSYGSHFTIAEKVRDKKGNVVFIAFNSNGYSDTTTKHKWVVRRAIWQDIVMIPKADFADSKKFAEYCLIEIKNAVVAQGRARAEHKKKEHETTINATRQNWAIYCQFMKQAGKKVHTLTKAEKLVLSSESIDIEAIRAAELTAIKKEMDEKKKRAKKLHQNELKWLKEWQDGANYLPYLQTIHETKLRIFDGRVETSRNASVSLDSAKLLWKMIEANKDVKGHKIDGYTVISMNGVLKIGCHEIERAEVERIGAELNKI